MSVKSPTERYTSSSLDLCLGLGKLHLVGDRPNTFKANLDNVTILEPNGGLAAHADTLGAMICTVSAATR